jgi:hypothetical protein
LRRKYCILFENRFSQANQRQAFYSAGPDNHERAQNGPPNCKTRFEALIQVGGDRINTTSKMERGPVTANDQASIDSVCLVHRRLPTGALNNPSRSLELKRGRYEVPNFYPQ